MSNHRERYSLLTGSTFRFRYVSKGSRLTGSPTFPSTDPKMLVSGSKFMNIPGFEWSTSILGPLLFLIFFDDFPQNLQKTKCIFHTQKITTQTPMYLKYKIVLNVELCFNFQSYLYENELILNLKTESMLLVRRNVGQKKKKSRTDN